MPRATVVQNLPVKTLTFARFSSDSSPEGTGYCNYQMTCIKRLF